MRSLSLLLGKELRDLSLSRAYWLLLAIIGPLVGQAFITAVNTYSEVSGSGARPAALAQGLSPLDGIFVPTFGAYDLAITLLFPFVAIRVLAAERESGAWNLVLQWPVPLAAILASKALALSIAWLIAWIPGVIAAILWSTYGGHAYPPELLNLFLGHMLRFALASGVAVAAAALARSSASAAIVTLAFTLGTWALDFVAAARGGWVSAIAAYTPSAALHAFEQGELRWRTVAVMLTISVALWVATGFILRRRILHIAVLAAVSVVAVTLAASIPASLDVSENRRNSFPPETAATLQQIRAPLKITTHLAAEDSRLADLERNVFAKLKRVLKVEIDSAATSRTGLFEGDRYGEIWYEYGGHRVMNRSTIEPVVLETIYHLAGVTPAPESQTPPYPGYPLNHSPSGAAWLFYAAWPLAVAIAAWLNWQR